MVTESGIGFCSALTLIFIVLKLLDKITWAWIWVISPLWMPAAFIVVVGTIAVLIGAFLDRKRG